jgi:hypothetical protein
MCALWSMITPTTARPPAFFVRMLTVFSPESVRTPSRTTSPGECVPISRRSTAGESTRIPSTETMTCVGWSLPAAGEPATTSAISAPFCFATTGYPRLRSATAAAMFCDSLMSRRSILCSVPSLTPGGRSADAGTSVAPLRICGKSLSSRFALRTKTARK